MRVLITAGGTGGHIYPAIALMESLRNKTTKLAVHWVCGTRELELSAVKSLGIPYSTLPVGVLPRCSLWGWPFFLAGFLVSMLKSFLILSSFQPDIIVGFGSFHSCPVIITAALMRIPSVICEQNVIPSLTNRMLAKFAKRVVLSFEETRRYVPRQIQARCVIIGNPVRKQIVVASGSVAFENLKLSRGKFTLLFLGGSQGAHAINKAAVETLNRLQNSQLASRVQYLLVTGESDYAWCRQQMTGNTLEGHVFAYMEDISPALAVSDLVIGRSGAGMLAEITARGLPAILVPYPLATNNHQLENARLLAEAGAARIIAENDLSASTLKSTIEDLTKNPADRDTMRAQSRTLGKPKAAENLSELIMQLMEEN